MSAVMRFRQGLRALTAWTRPVDEALAESVLTPELMALFRRLRRGERLHSLSVLRAVRAVGATDPGLAVTRDLEVAALLHDVGKTVGPFYFHERVLVVLVRRFLPALYDRWGQGEPHGWTRPFAISRRHAAWSAQMVAAAGGSPCAVELCRRHADPVQGPPGDEVERLLLVLQGADDRN